MKHIFRMTAAALLLFGAFTSCSKEEKAESDNNIVRIGTSELKIGKVEEVEARENYYGITFKLFSIDNIEMGFIELSTAHEGKTVDLTQIDPANHFDKSTKNHYSYFIKLDSPGSVYIWGGDDVYSSLAESGTLKYSFNNEILTLDVNAVTAGQELFIHYKGKTVK